MLDFYFRELPPSIEMRIPGGRAIVGEVNHGKLSRRQLALCTQSSEENSELQTKIYELLSFRWHMKPRERLELPRRKYIRRGSRIKLRGTPTLKVQTEEEIVQRE